MSDSNPAKIRLPIRLVFEGVFGAPTHYLLIDRRPVQVHPDDWWDWFRKIENRRVGEDQVGPFRVSTVFIGLNAGIEDPPLLFETEAYDSDGASMLRCHCATWEEAEVQHTVVVEEVRKRMEEEQAMATDPETPEEWQKAVNSARLLMELTKLQRLGLLEGPQANTARCEEILRRGRERGIEPEPMAKLIEHLHEWGCS